MFRPATWGFLPVPERAPDLIDSMRPEGLCLTAVKRVATIGISALLLWALAPGVGEFFESAVHFVQEGHSAHSTPDGDHHDPPGPEHGCTGTLHLCPCCVSSSFLLTQGTAQLPVLELQEFVATAHAYLSTISPRGVDHPPRA